MFDKRGVMIIERSASIDEDELMMAALDAGAEDFIPQDDVYEVYTSVSDFSAVREALESAGYGFLSAELSMIPQNTVDISADPEMVQKVERLSGLKTMTTFRRSIITRCFPKRKKRNE